MARWAVCWILLISLASVGSYAGTNALLAGRGGDDSPAMLSLVGGGGPGTALCQRAERAFVNAAAGSRPTASADLRAAWDRAALVVVQACADV